jgi:hypothetical protein
LTRHAIPPPYRRPRAWPDAIALGAVLAATAVVLVLLGRREAIGYDSYWHVFIARQDRWPNFWREVRDNAHPPLFYLLLRAASALFGPGLLTYRLISIASTVAAAAAIAAVVARITANRPLAVVAAAAFGLSYGPIVVGLEVRAYAMCAAATMAAVVFYLDWFALSRHRSPARASTGFAIAATVAVLTHYSTFFFLAAAVATPFALAIVSRDWRRRLAGQVAAHPLATALMFGVPLAAAGTAYAVHVVLWGGGRLSHVPPHMFNPATETAARFLWRNTLNLAAILLPGGNEFVAGIYNAAQRVALAIAAGVVVAGTALIARRQAPRRAAVPVVLLVVMVALNAIGGLTLRYPYGGAARHEFFLVPFAIVVLFSLVEIVRRALPARMASRRATAVVAAAGVAASIASWTSSFQVSAQAMFQPQMDAFRRAVPTPRAVLLDQFSFINFFSHYHDWQWRAGDDFPGEGVRQLWTISRGDARIVVCRGGPQWSFDMSSVETFDTVVECGQRAGVGRVAIFRTRWWDSPPGLATFDRRAAADDGVITRAWASDGDGTSVEFDVDPAALHDCTARPAPPPDLRVVVNANRTVTLAWAPVGSSRTRYTVEAGLRPGGADALNMSIGRVTTYTATRVTPAIYYARVRARNACGTSEPSRELRVIVP